jgi:DNA-directed RNA polymerase subunit RPC12/RpoP
VSKIYTCAACGDDFEGCWSDEEAALESKTLWGDMPASEMVVICDDCFQRGKDEALARHHAGMVKQ